MDYTPERELMREYTAGMFDAFKQEDNYELWDGFPQLMQDLGYKMDCRKSFEEYQKHCKLTLNPAKSKRDERRNTLYLLEHAERQIVGNFLFSEWRYYTHWAMPGESDAYVTDYLQRIICILEAKHNEDQL